MKKLTKLVWVGNGDYLRTFEYHRTALNVGWAWSHRNLYNGLNTVTVAEVGL